MKTRILILGSSGILGKNLVKNLNYKYKVFHNGLNQRKFELTKYNLLKGLVRKTNPDLVVNCAAVTDLDYCENNKLKSKKVNVGISKNLYLIKKIYKLNFNVIQISTDQMYDKKTGSKSTEKCKLVCLNEYTKQKLKAEKIGLNNSALIFRLNFFSNEKKNLFRWILKSCKTNRKIYLFKDIYFNPLSVMSLSKIISKIIPIILKKNVKGIYNLGCKNGLSKSEFSILIIKKLGNNFKNYKIVLSDKFFKTKRPKNMIMNVNKFQKKFKIGLPIIKNEINNYIRYLNVKI